MALPPSTANWHWKNKDVTRWGREWFERELTTLNVMNDAESESVSIKKVTNVEGDIELGQRKSKLITIYEVKVEMKWEGTASDGTQVQGKVTVPEVSHEITVDRISDYEYQWTMTTASSPVADAVFALAKSRLPAALETKFAEFPVAMVDIHGKDLTVSIDSSRSGTPAPPGNSMTSSGSSAPPVPSATERQPVKPKPDLSTINTSTVTLDANFMAPADDLFNLLTDEKRIPIWTRNPAKSTPQDGAEYSLFGGNVFGKYISLTPPNEIIQSWALKSPIWPAGHFATLKTTLTQSTDSTEVVFTLEGVPTGMEDVTRGNIDGYYIQGFKSIGYVQLVYSSPPACRTPPSLPSKTGTNKRPYATIAIALAVLVTTLSIPYFTFYLLS